MFFRNAKTEDPFINNAWKMANAFNENHKLHSWVIHYDEVNFVELKKVIEKIIGLSKFTSAFCVKANWSHLSYFRYSNSAGNA